MCKLGHAIHVFSRQWTIARYASNRVSLASLAGSLERIIIVAERDQFSASAIGTVHLGINETTLVRSVTKTEHIQAAACWVWADLELVWCHDMSRIYLYTPWQCLTTAYNDNTGRVWTCGADMENVEPYCKEVTQLNWAGGFHGVSPREPLCSIAADLLLQRVQQCSVRK